MRVLDLEEGDGVVEHLDADRDHLAAGGGGGRGGAGGRGTSARALHLKETQNFQ